MSTPRIARLVAAILLMCTLVYADSKPKDQPASRPISEQTRMALIRALNAELVYARRAIPAGEKGLTIKDGTISPGDREIAGMIATNGTAVKPGDAARITAILIKKDTITFEINGGPKKKAKWYQRIQVGGMGGTTPVSNPDPNSLNSRGSYVRLQFDKYVPDMSLDQVKQLLKPVLNFDAKSAVEAYMDSVPPKVRDAIKNHQVLVGMNREMVTYAKGRPPKKIREKDDHNTDYEEWIYGEPPQEVTFVRFVGDEVTRLEVMKVNGEKVLRTEKEVDLSKPTVAQTQGESQAPAQGPGTTPTAGPGKRPSLRRPGEEVPTSTTGPVQSQPQQVPGQSPMPNPPGQPPGQPPGVPTGPPPLR